MLKDDFMENKQILIIPENRIGVLIGNKGSTKKLLERKFKSKITVDSNTGKVEIESSEGLNLYVLKNIIEVIGYGHNPEVAMCLEDENYVFDIINVKDYVKKDKVKKVLGRVIGRKGNVRNVVYEITKCNMAVSNEIISFVGAYENVHILREGLLMLIKGAPHKAFYSYLERNKVDY